MADTEPVLDDEADAGALVPSTKAIEVLKLLRASHNVILSGPPATGKSHLISEVARLFETVALPGYDPEGDVPYPNEELPEGIQEWLPSPERAPRQSFETVFHPHTKHRDVVRGIAPRLDEAGGFYLKDGILYEANEYAMNGAALLVIEELNRGPAVQLFGESILTIEHDKRLAPDGTKTARTKTFRLPSADGGEADYALSHHLYLLAAMNQADTSVEPLDVAFLRRWERYDLEPDPVELALHLQLEPNDAPLPETIDGDTKRLYRAALRAWDAVNRRIVLGRGPDYRIGHGVLMDPYAAPNNLDEAVAFLMLRWQRIRTHIDEVFFGDARAVAQVLNIQDFAGHPYTFAEQMFAGEPVPTIVAPTPADADELYAVLRAIAG